MRRNGPIRHAYSFLHINHGSDLDPLKEGKDIGVVHAKTAKGRVGANRLGPVCSVNAVGSIAQNEHGYAQRIIGTGLDELGSLGLLFRIRGGGAHAGLRTFREIFVVPVHFRPALPTAME